MPKSTEQAPRYTQAGACPAWCDCESCEWIEREHYVMRSHSSLPAFSAGQGNDSDPAVSASIGADEWAVLSRGQRGPSLLDEARVALYVEVSGQGAVHADLTPSRARELAQGLLAVADRLEARRQA